MIKAPPPANEAQRLLDLLSYEVLDTPPEVVFDDIAKLASMICGTSVALVSLIDKDRQWFKSHHGLDATQTPRDLAFCAHAILGTDIFEVADSRLDERFADNPLVTGAPNVVFYAGAPLVNDRGHALGTLCVLGQQPSVLSPEQRFALAALARQVMTQLEHRRIHADLQAAYDALKEKSQLVLEREASLVQSGKMTVLGEMAGAVAHEINNPLAVIHGNVRKLLKLAQQAPEPAPEQLQALEVVNKTTTRIANIVKSLLAFSRDDNGELFSEENLADLLRDVLALCQHRLDQDRINVTLDLSSGAVCECLPVPMSQVIMNLLINAIEAAGASQARWIHIKLSGQGDDLVLSIADSGGGVPAQIQDRIMMPFFTTKSFGMGPGLGLSTAKGIIERHGGDLTLQQPPTTFVVRLPRRQAAAAETQSTRHQIAFK